MVSAIKEICIFMIIAQAVLFFVPGGPYMKYVRVLVGIIMILWVTKPVFALVFDDGKKQEIRERAEDFGKMLEESGKGLEMEGSGIDIYGSIEEELKSRLEGCEGDYEVVEVRLSDAARGEKEGGEILITVAEKSADSGREIRIEPVKLGERAAGQMGQEEGLKEMYGALIGVDSGRIKIILR